MSASTPARVEVIPNAGVTWLPDFCAVNTIGAVIALTQIVVLVILLAPDSGLRLNPRNFVVVSAFGQWIAFCIVAVLCKSRDRLSRLSRWAGYAIAFVLICAIAALGSALVFYLERGLELGITPRNVGFAQFVGSVTAVTAVVAIAALRYFELQQRQTASERAQVQSQLIALQARIRPHFLFNTLNTIASLVRVRPADAEDAIENLSELMRAALKQDHQVSDFGAQRELCERYLAIEKLRMRDRLQVQWLVDAVPKDLPLPDFLLQPLVENAVLHGLSPRAEGGTIRIEADAQDQHWRLRVHNPKPEVTGHLHKGNRMALSNIEARLRHLYGDAAKLEVEDARDYHAVTIWIPKTVAKP